MNFTTRALITALTLFATTGTAATYNFDIVYSGSGVSALQPGSDTPTGTNILPGDDFDWTITAEGDEFWRVDTGRGFFPLMAFLSLPTAVRVGDFDLELLHDGSSVFTLSEIGATNSYVHLGTNTVNLATGLAFDQLVLHYVLTSSTYQNPNDPGDPLNGTPADSILSGNLPLFGAPEQNQFSPGIVYIESAVPEPGTYALLSAGFTLLGLAAVRRSRQSR